VVLRAMGDEAPRKSLEVLFSPVDASRQLPINLRQRADSVHALAVASRAVVEQLVSKAVAWGAFKR
jgi:hypothetical protein